MLKRTTVWIVNRPKIVLLWHWRNFIALIVILSYIPNQYKFCSFFIFLVRSVSAHVAYWHWIYYMSRKGLIWSVYCSCPQISIVVSWKWFVLPSTDIVFIFDLNLRYFATGSWYLVIWMFTSGDANFANSIFWSTWFTRPW